MLTFWVLCFKICPSKSCLFKIEMFLCEYFYLPLPFNIHNLFTRNHYRRALKVNIAQPLTFRVLHKNVPYYPKFRVSETV